MDSTIQYASAGTDGGALATYGGSAIIVTDSRIAHGSVGRYGAVGWCAAGSVVLTNVEMFDMSAVMAAWIYTYVGAPDVTCTSCMFKKLKATVYGAMTVAFPGAMNFYNCVVNGTECLGGALLGAGATIMVKNTTFISCVAVEEGAVAYPVGGVLTFNNCTMMHSRAGKDGGVFYITGGSILVTNRTLMLDSANSDWGNGFGGTISVAGGAVTVENSTIRSSNTPNRGGACVTRTGTLTLRLGTLLADMRASNGGALMMLGGVINVESGTVIQNCSTPFGDGYGGMILATGGNLYMSDSMVYNASALTAGGVFCAYGGGSMFVSRSYIEHGFASQGAIADFSGAGNPADGGFLITITMATFAQRDCSVSLFNGAGQFVLRDLTFIALNGCDSTQ
eukprot:5190105-Prymnesium_polylepis.1